MAEDRREPCDHNYQYDIFSLTALLPQCRSCALDKLIVDLRLLVG